jgi:DeoR/GlpR family transcriptional regulator of sugar metabolism
MAAILGSVRKDKILNFLRDHSAATVAELSDLCEVSEVTIRQDLNHLAVEGMLVRTRGGAVLSSRAAADFTFAARAAVNADAKQRIGEMAATFIQSGDAVLLDASTTGLYVARALAQRSDLVDVTVITSGINTALELINRLDIQTFLTGGQLRASTVSLSGSFVWDMLGRIYATVGFFGARGLTIAQGFTEANLQEADVKRRMRQRCQEVIVGVDGGKFGQVALAPFGEITSARRIITDDTAPEADLNLIRQLGVEVIVV